MKSLERIIWEHPFFAGLEEDFLRLISGCAKNVVFQSGDYLFHQGAPADQFYLLRHGRVGLEITAPGRGTLTFETLVAGEIVGVSWLFPPYRWAYDARALELTRTISLDAACLRGKCDEDHHLGYDLMKRFVPIVIDRLHATQMQILDVYGTSS